MLTPIDIQNRHLKSKMGGYDKKDTDDFLEEIKVSYEELYKENQSLKEKITSLSEGIQYYKKMESTLQKALVLAEKTSSETQEAAKSQADSLVNEATAKAEAMSRETKAEIESLRREAQAQAEVTKAKANRELEETRNHVRKLVQSYENYRLQFKKLAEAQIEMLDSESFSIFVPELDELMNEAPSADSVMDNPGIIPINIGSPAPFVELPDESREEAPKVEEVPVEESSFTVPVTSDEPPVEEPVAVEVPITEAASEEPSVDIPVSIPSIEIPVSTPPVGDTPAMEPVMEVPVTETETATEEPSIAIPVNTPVVDEIPVAAPNLDIPEITPVAVESPIIEPEVEIPVITPNMDIPMTTPITESPFVEPVMDTSSADAASSDNGIIGMDPAPVESSDNSMIDVSSFMDMGADLSAPAATAEPIEEPASADTANGIIGDPFIDTGSFIDPVGAPTAAEPFKDTASTAEAKSKPEDNFIDINPFNFIDPE